MLLSEKLCTLRHTLIFKKFQNYAKKICEFAKKILHCFSLFEVLYNCVKFRRFQLTILSISHFSVQFYPNDIIIVFIQNKFYILQKVWVCEVSNPTLRHKRFIEGHWTQLRLCFKDSLSVFRKPLPIRIKPQKRIVCASTKKKRKG